MSGNLNVSNNQTDTSSAQVQSSKVQALLGAAFLAALGAPSHALGAQDTPLALRMSGSISTQVDSAIAANTHFEFNDTDVALLLKLSDLPTFIEWKKVSTPGIGVDAFAKAAFGPSANWKYLIDKKGKLISGEQGLRHGELYTIAKDEIDAKRIIQQIKGANNLKSTNSTPEVVRETLKGVPIKPSVLGLKGEKSVANKVEKSLSYKHLQRPILDFRSVPQEARPEILIGMVQTFKGIPYAWGGNGGKTKNFSVAFDCTGLGNASFYFTGVFKDGTRLISTQFPGITTNIRSAQLAKRGDIAFIKEDGKTSHITFVLDSASNGHIHVIDAPGKGKVVMERVLPVSAFSFVGTPKIYFDSQVTESEEKLTVGEKALTERVDDTFKNEAIKHTSSEGVKKGIEEHIAYFEMLAANDENFKRTVIALKIVEADMKKKLVKKAIEQFTPLANRGVENAENTLKKLVKQGSVLDVRLEKLKTLKAENDTWRNQKFSELIYERKKYKSRIRLSEAQVEKNLPGAQKILLSLQHKLHTVDEAIKILGYSNSEIDKVSEAA